MRISNVTLLKIHLALSLQIKYKFLKTPTSLLSISSSLFPNSISFSPSTLCSSAWKVLSIPIGKILLILQKPAWFPLLQEDSVHTYPPMRTPCLFVTALILRHNFILLGCLFYILRTVPHSRILLYPLVLGSDT